MKRRSISGFVTGLVGIVSGLPIGFYSFIFLALILGFGGYESLSNSVYLFLAAGILAIIAVCFYFTKARVGGILMLIAFLLYITPYIFGIYALLSSGTPLVEILFLLLVGNIPTLLLFISAMLGLFSKARQTNI